MTAQETLRDSRVIVGLNVVAGTNVAGNIEQYELCQVANKL